MINIDIEKLRQELKILQGGQTVKVINVLIDEGHRHGIDSGGIAPSGQTEAKTALNVGEFLRLEFERYNNTNDYFHFNVTNVSHIKSVYMLKANDRLKWANQQKFNVSISIHLNDSDNETVRGIETLFNGFNANSKLLAELTQYELSRGFVDRGVKVRNDLAMLKIQNCASILAELGFMTEADFKTVDTFKEQEEKGKRLFKGTLKYCTVVY